MGIQRSSTSPGPLSGSRRSRRLGILLRRAWFSLNQTFRRRCAALGLTPDQYTALRTLVEGDKEGMTQTQLVEAMCSDPNTITSLLQRLEAGGWVERRRHETDRRAHRVRVLPAGRRKFRQALHKAIPLQREVLGVLSEEERAHFLNQLERVAEACQRTMAQKIPPRAAARHPPALRSPTPRHHTAT